MNSQPLLLRVLLLLSALLSQCQSLSSPTSTSSSSTITNNSNHIHTLLLCRHGDSIWNGGTPGTQETFTGWTDVPLSSKGITEAKNTATQLSRHFSDNGNGNEYGNSVSDGVSGDPNPMRIDVCLTSKLQRAKQTAHHCLWAFATQHQHHNHNQYEPLYKEDYRLNERHYGALQGYIKSHIEEGRYGHSPLDVQAWRRGWYAIPPLLEEEDGRRQKELKGWEGHCGGRENVPRGESLEMVAEGRIRPFLGEVLHPLMMQAAERRNSGNGVNGVNGVNGGVSVVNGVHGVHVNGNVSGGCALIVAHANSLRALIGVICQVEKDEAALKRLEAMKIQTGVPLILKYRQLDDGTFEACNVFVEEAVVGGAGAGFGLSNGGGGGLNNGGGDYPSPDLPVWPLSSIPKTYHATRSQSQSQSQQYHFNSSSSTRSNVDMEKRRNSSKRTRAKEIRIDVI